MLQGTTYVWVHNSTFKNVLHGGRDGGLAIEGATEVLITECIFRNNSALRADDGQ